MGRVHSEVERAQTLQKARALQINGRLDHAPTTVSDIYHSFSDDLYTYFCLCNASRTARTSDEIREEALSLVFRFRTSIEKKIVSELKSFSKDLINGGFLYRHNMFSFSKKQGVSFRFPLTTCVPSKRCASLCYAHDRLDAAPFAVIKGAVNEFIAKVFEQKPLNPQLEDYLRREVRKVIKHAQKEASLSAFKRAPRVRLAHVGEMPAYPNFTKHINSMIRDLSNGTVMCVLYTRHPDAGKLRQEDMVVNFTLDDSSLNRKRYAPNNSRLVSSSFDGLLDPLVEVNFLEHHGSKHFAPVGQGNICPATDAKIEGVTCDACRCDLCFKPTF